MGTGQTHGCARVTRCFAGTGSPVPVNRALCGCGVRFGLKSDPWNPSPTLRAERQGGRALIYRYARCQLNEEPAEACIHCFGQEEVDRRLGKIGENSSTKSLLGFFQQSRGSVVGKRCRPSTCQLSAREVQYVVLFFFFQK